jgi:glycosyltransferase involved in cell wall biosynthesis
MLISILIPVYNWDISLLISSLSIQIEELTYPCEIIIIDDASTINTIKNANKNLISLINKNYISYHALEINMGRSKIRNLLSEKAKGEYFLFLDADTVPDTKSFLKNYIDTITLTSSKIVLGGISYKNIIKKEDKYSFYLYMGKKIGEIPTSLRSINPWRYVITSNILIHSEIFKKIPIDTTFNGYGYEDSEWGIRLMNVCKIIHIDNTVSHLGLETKEDLLSKLFASAENFDRLIVKHNKIAQTWKLSFYVNQMLYLPKNVLSIILRFLTLSFKYCPVHKVSLILFQSIKIVAFAKYKKDKILSKSM